MLALAASAPRVSVEEGARLAHELYGLLGEVTALPGERDSNFHLRTREAREFVLKVIDANAPAGALDCQLAVLKHLAEQAPSLPVQRLYPTTTGADVGLFERGTERYSVCLLGYLEGQLLVRTRPSPALLQSIGRTLAQLDRALQGFYHPALAPDLAWDVRRLPELEPYLPLVPSAAIRARLVEVIEDLKRRLPAIRALRSQAIHGDCHGSNLLIDPTAHAITGILDFGDMLHAPRILEVAVAIAELLSEDLVPLEAAATLLGAYARESALEAAEVDVLYDLVRARHAITLLLHAWRSRHDPSGATLLEAATVHAARSLEELELRGREALTQAWQLAAGAADSDPSRVTLERRRRLMGAGAELFYERPLHLVRGSGVYLYDAEGREYLDVYNNVPHVGHTHPRVVAAIQRQVATLVTHTRYLHAAILEYAERLTASLPRALDTCLFVNSGSEANDIAWRLARSATGGNGGGLVFEHAYHGITEAVAALTPSGGRPRDPRVVTLGLPPPHLRASDTMSDAARSASALDAEQALATLAARGLKPAACYIDSGLTSSGILDPPPAWTATWAEPVRRAGALIVGDEVQYGLGRSGSHLWGFERRGLVPDIVTLGKPVGNGYPMGVVIAPRALVEAFQAKFGFFSTFGGNPVAAAAGIAVLEVLEREQLMANARATGEYLTARLDALRSRCPLLESVRGVGLMIGVSVRAHGELPAPRVAKFIVNHMAAQSRVLIGTEGAHGEVLKLRPPMPFGAAHADRLVAAIEAAATALADL